MARMRIHMESSVLTRDIIKSFILHCKAKVLSDKTIATYEQQFSAIEKHIDLDKPIQFLCKKQLEEILVSMRESGLSANSIKSHTRTLSSFFSWCREEEIANLYYIQEFESAILISPYCSYSEFRQSTRSALANVAASLADSITLSTV